MDALLPEFFARDTETVARDLLGRVIVRDPVRMRIVETEAYLPDDTACHAFRGCTPRNAPMFGPPGRAYVYLVYGLHHLLNFVTEAEGRAAAVLIRGGLVLAGHDRVRERRGGRLDCLGPGKVGQALGLDTSWSGRALTGPLHVIAGIPATRVRRTPRVGIDYAAPADRDALRRYLLVE